MDERQGVLMVLGATIKAGALALVCVALMAFPVIAQDASPVDDLESSIFGSAGDTEGQATDSSGFDAMVTSGNREKTEYLVGGTAIVGLSGSVSDGMAVSEAGARGILFGKVSVPRYGSLFLSYSASDVFFQGYSGPSPAPETRDPYEMEWYLSEFHYSFDIGKTVFVRLGNQLLSWGPSRIWTPVDFINLEKADFFSSLDARTGKPGLRLHVPFPRGNVFLFSDFSAISADGRYGNPYKTVNTGARIDVTAGNAEFGLTAYGGYSTQGKIGFDVSGRVVATSVYGEVAYSPASSGYDDSLQVSLGFSRSLDERKLWSLSAEGFYNSGGFDASGYTMAEYMALPAAERIPLYQGRWYGYAAIATSEFLSPYFGSELGVLSNITEGSFKANLSGNFSFPRVIPFKLSIYWYGGKDNGEFTRYTGNNALGYEARATISF